MNIRRPQELCKNVNVNWEMFITHWSYMLCIQIAFNHTLQTLRIDFDYPYKS